MSRIKPVSADLVDDKSLKKTGGFSFKKWTRMVACSFALPVGYLWLPFTCCAKNPLVKYAFDEYEHPNRKEMFDKDEDEKETCLENFIHNLGGMIAGGLSMMTCCCCCAMGCTIEPKDVF